MEPNLNQPTETNPLVQPTTQPPVPPVEPAAPIAPTPAPTNTPETPKGTGRKSAILIIILLLLVIGMAAYILFAKNQVNENQKAATDNSSLELPTPTQVPTPAPEEDLEVASPEADLLDLEADLKGL